MLIPMRDKFRAIMTDRRDVDKTNASASSIFEDISETHQMLDDLTQEKDSEEELHKEKMDGASAQEHGPVWVGDELQCAAVRRAENEMVEEMSERKKTRKRKHDECEEQEEWNALVQKQLTAKRKKEKHANNLRAAGIQLMRERFEQDKLDREVARKQNAKQLELISAVINKF